MSELYRLARQDFVPLNEPYVLSCAKFGLVAADWGSYLLKTVQVA
jgi:hypothetical protein